MKDKSRETTCQMFTTYSLRISQATDRRGVLDLFRIHSICVHHKFPFILFIQVNMAYGTKSYIIKGPCTNNIAI